MKYAAAAVALLVALCMGVWLRSGGVDDAGTPVSTDDVPAAYRAIVVEEYGDADRMTIGTRPMPSVVGPTDVIVRVAYAGVNPVDYKLRRGNLQLVMSLPLPFTPGFDFSGTVAAVGSGVAKLRVGTFGTWVFVGGCVWLCVCGDVAGCVWCMHTHGSQQATKCLVGNHHSAVAGRTRSSFS